MELRTIGGVALVAVLTAACARSHAGAGDAGRPAGRDAGTRDADTRDASARDAAPDAWRPATDDAWIDAPDAGPACAPAPERCDGADQDCDGIVDEGDALCPFNHASGACVAGECALVACDPGFADCDGEPANGCERDVRTDRESCGACGLRCALTEACVEGRCEREDIVDFSYAYLGDRGCVVLASGRLLCWGRNDFHQILYETTDDQLEPVQVAADPGVRRCAQTGSALCVATAGNRVLCRGRGPGFEARGFRTIGALADVVEMRAGAGHFCAIQASGALTCWGGHQPSGELGIGSSGPYVHWEPITPLGLPEARTLSAEAGCAVDPRGQAWCWGRTFVVDGDTTFLMEPLRVPPEDGALRISHASWHGCFVDASQTLRCWGRDSLTGFGMGATALYRAPIPLDHLGRVRDVQTSSGLTVVLTDDGRVLFWGLDITQPPPGVLRPLVRTPRHLPGLDGAVRIAIGDSSICAQIGTRSVRCVGNNRHGQLGDGTREHRAEPVAVLGLD